LQSVTFAGDLATFSRANAQVLIARGANVATSNVEIISTNAASVNVVYRLTGLSSAQISLALAYFRANCATLLAQSGVDCNTIASMPIQTTPTQCYFGDLNVPAGVNAVGPGCATGSITSPATPFVLVDHTKSCVLTSTSSIYSCVNPTCNAGKWSTNYPCIRRDEDQDSLAGGAIAGIVIGCVLGVVGLVIVIVVAIAVTAPPKHLPADGTP
jgi:hypothetical protein